METLGTLGSLSDLVEGVTLSVQLYTHSDYSLMQSLLTVESLVRRAQELGIKTLALTDYNTTAGHGELEFFCKQAGIKAIFGLELDVAYTETGQAPLVILAQNSEGYGHLLHLASLEFPVSLGELVKHKEGLFVLDGGDRGRMGSLLLNGDLTEARNLFVWYEENLAPNFYLRHDLGQNVDFLAVFPHAPLILGQDVRWINEEDLSREALGVLGQLAQREALFPPFPLLSWEELCSEASASKETISATIKVGEACNVSLPQEQLLPPHPADLDLRDLVWKGAKARFSEITLEVKERLEHELAIIEEQNFEDYFLIVADIVKFAKENDIPVGPGRGSAASSLVAYCLGITEIDPLKWGLLFERFLNKARKTRPDIDLDFCYERRQEVLNYVSKRFGPDHVAQIGTYGTFGERSAKQEVKRVLGYEKLSVARKIQGLKRHRATHAAGVIITAKPTKAISAVYGDRELPVTHLDMYSLERLGALKIDLLGLRTLTLLDKMERAVQSSDPNFSLKVIPLEDAKTFNILSEGKSHGIFQLESKLFQDLLRSLQPSSFADLFALLALGRPGPLDIFPDYLERRKSPGKIRYLTSETEEILKETYGLILYQEQVILLAHRLAGLSLGDADLLRISLGKNDHQATSLWRGQFLEGAQKKGLTEIQATNLFNQIQKFSGYAFNKAHSVSYALLTWQGAYLKANYPVEFFTTILNEGVSLQEQSTFLLECQALGVTVLPPSIEYARVKCVPEGPNLRLGLSSIRQLGSYVASEIVQKRQILDFKDFPNLRRQLKLDSKVWEILVLAGACDGLGARNSLLRELGLPPLTGLELLGKERELLGIYLSAHPAKPFQPLMRNLRGELDVVVGEILDVKRMGTTVRGFLDSPEGTVVFIAKIAPETRDIRLGESYAFFGRQDGGVWLTEWLLPLGPILLVSPELEELENLKLILNQQKGTKPVILRLGDGSAYHLLPREFWIEQVPLVNGELEKSNLTYVWFDPWKELLF